MLRGGRVQKKKTSREALCVAIINEERLFLFISMLQIDHKLVLSLYTSRKRTYANEKKSLEQTMYMVDQIFVE